MLTLNDLQTLKVFRGSSLNLSGSYVGLQLT